MRGGFEPEGPRRIYNLDAELGASIVETPRIMAVRPFYPYAGPIRIQLYPGEFQKERQAFIAASCKDDWDFCLELLKKKPLAFLGQGRETQVAIAKSRVSPENPLLLHLCRQGAPYELLKRVLDLGADPCRCGTLTSGGSSRENVSPMHVLAFRQDMSRARLLHSYGATFNDKDAEAETPLHLFMQGEKLKAEDSKKIEYFVAECKESVNQQSRDLMESPLHMSVVHDSSFLTGCLLRAGAVSSLTDVEGVTALERALSKGKFSAARILYPKSPLEAQEIFKDPKVLEQARAYFTDKSDYAGNVWVQSIYPDMSEENVQHTFAQSLKARDWSSALALVKNRSFSLERAGELDELLSQIREPALRGDNNAQELWFRLVKLGGDFDRRAFELLVSTQIDETAYLLNEYNIFSPAHNFTLSYDSEGRVAAIDSTPPSLDFNWTTEIFNHLNLDHLSDEDQQKLFLNLLPTSFAVVDKFGSLSSKLREKHGPYFIEMGGELYQDKDRCVRRIADALYRGASFGAPNFERSNPVILNSIPLYWDLFSQEVIDAISISKVAPIRRDEIGAESSGASITLLARLAVLSFEEPVPLRALLEAQLELTNHPQGVLNAADLSGITLDRYDFVRHTLYDCNLSGTDLSKSLIGNGNLAGSIYSDQTKFPANFDPKNEGLIHRSEDAAFVITVQDGKKISMTFDQVLQAQSNFGKSHLGLRHHLGDRAIWSFKGVSGVFHTYLATKFIEGGPIGQYALLSLLPHLLFKYEPSVSSGLGHSMDGGFYGGRGVNNPSVSEYLAMLNHPKNPKFLTQYIGPISIGITSLPHYLGKNIQITGTTIYNWARIGTLGLSFLRWRFDAQRVFKDGKQVGLSLLEAYGMTPLKNDPNFGSGFSFQRGKNKNLDLSVLTPDGRRHFPFDHEALIVLRRGLLLCSVPHFGTLIIRNSSPVFGRDKLPGAAYWSSKSIGQGFAKEELENISRAGILKHFNNILDVEINVPRAERTSDLQTDLHVLIAHLDGLFSAYSEWKFATSSEAFTPEFLDPNRTMTGGYVSPGFAHMLDFLEAGVAEGKSYDLAFTSPFYIPWSPFTFKDGEGKTVSRLSVTQENLDILRELNQTGQSKNRRLRESGVRSFIQEAGFKHHSELLILAPEAAS